jgi:hypothetical protein
MDITQHKAVVAALEQAKILLVDCRMFNEAALLREMVARVCADNQAPALNPKDTPIDCLLPDDEACKNCGERDCKCMDHSADASKKVEQEQNRLYAVAVTMKENKATVLNIMTYLDLVFAKSDEEARGMGINGAMTKKPQHQVLFSLVKAVSRMADVSKRPVKKCKVEVLP